MFKLIKQVLLVFQLLLVTSIAFAQDRTVTGKVTSQQGEGLPGVTVSVKGTNIGTITDVDGVYKLTLAADVKKLTFSFIGFREQTVEVGTQSVIDIKLQEENKQLDEVVVTGLASSVKRSNLANSVASVSADQLVGATKPATLDNALSGKIIGANIVQNSGAPGGGISIKLRGISSINGSSEPLYIIDGIIVNNSQFGSGAGSRAFSGASSAANATSQDQSTNRMSDINPADIENIEILKGPSAAAIYGTRANAGVIIITTKRGKAGRTKINFRQDIGASSAIRLLGSEGWNDAKIDQYGGVYGMGVAEAKAALRAANGQTWDWEKEIYGNTGTISNTGLSISGGTEKTQFMISGGINSETGIQKRTGFGRRTLAANIDHRISKSIGIKSSSSYMNSENQRSFSGNDNNGVSLGYALAYIPNFINLFPNAQGIYPASNAGTNPLQTVDKTVNSEQTNRFMQSLSSDIYFFQNERSSLKLALTGGFDFLLTESELYMPDDLLSQKAFANPGASRLTKSRNLNAYLQSFLSYNYKLWRLDLTSQVGLVRLITDREITGIEGNGLPAGQKNPALATVRTIDQTFAKWQDVGIIGQQEFNFEDKIVATVGIRADKSSLNGDNTKWFLFPRASGAVNITKFDFWKIDKVSQLKLRAAYGETGGVPNFGNTFTSMASGVIGGRLGLFAPSVNGNAGITPETASELEFGIDLGFLDNRIGVEVTYYDKKVFNLINPFTTAASTGVTSIQAYPVGDLKNTGIELGINASVVKNTNFTWTTGINYWFNRSEMTRLIIPDSYVGSGFGTFGRNRLSLGNSPTAFYGTPNVPIKDAAGNTVGTTPTKYGDNQPKFQLSWSNNFKIYKNFDLSFLIHTSQGGFNSSLNYVLKDEGGTTGDWSKPSGEVDGSGRPIPMGQTARSFAGISATPSTTANAIQDASYIRLREVALYYTVPKTALNKVFKNVVENVKVGVSGNNLITITDYYGYDPEASNFGNQAVGAGIDLLSFPSTKRMFFHLAVEF